MSSTERVRRWRAANPDRYRELERQRPIRKRKRKRNSEERARANQKYRLSHPDVVKTWNAKRCRNLLRLHETLRRYRRRYATPQWLNATGQRDAIIALYGKARKLRLVVDHDIPLGGCRICGAMGLHVLANLRLVTKEENSSKHARCSGCV